MNKLHIEKIDGIRGVAILLVLAYHTLLVIFPGYELKKYSENGILEINSFKSFFLNFNPIGQGYIGVELFLVISGFLIHLIYLRNGSQLNLKLFFSKRFWRIYPPYLIILSLFFVNKIDLSGQGIKNILSHIFLIHNLNDKTFFSINPSFWSIALECQLYLIYPIYLYIIRCFGNNKSLTLILFINLILSSLALFHKINSLSYGTFVLKFWFVWCSGAYLAQKYYKNERIFKNPFIWCLSFYFMFVLFKLFVYSKYFILIPVTFFCVAFMETIIHNSHIDKFYISRKLFKIFSFLGLISYSIYLTHQPLLRYLMFFYKPITKTESLNTLVSLVFTWLTLFLISYFLYRLLEIKSIRYGQKLRNKFKN